MRQTFFVIAGSILLASCAHSGDDAATTPVSSTAKAIDGEAVYTEYCAECHKTGKLGAPREGEPQDWQGRSNLWQGVLMEHAKTGFFDMPARGGKSELPDELVEAAAEYMLEHTFPDRPSD